MKHIIVTTPKSEMKNAELEAKECIDNGSGYYFRKMSRQPKDIVIGESRIYYVEDGYIRGYATIIGFSQEENLECETTGKTWANKDGGFLWMPACTWKWIAPIPMKGFQGWRYFDDSDIEIVGGWLDPKP